MAYRVRRRKYVQMVLFLTLSILLAWAVCTFIDSCLIEQVEKEGINAPHQSE